MMLPLLLAAVVLTGDSTYSSPALRALVARAASQNRTVPAALRSYEARVESEIAVMTHRPDGGETAVSVEQSLNEVRWQRDGSFAQYLTAYRARQSGPTLSALAFLRHAWTIPVLYGNRLSLFFGLDSSKNAPRDEGGTGNAEAGTLAVHPFAIDRDAVYRFTGGDTIAVMRTERRAIPVVRILVEPRAAQPRWPVVVFRGEIDVDATRGEIVRMRGSFLTSGRNGPVSERLAVVPLETVAFVELESREVEGRYWLPAYQRIEAQVAIGGVGESRTAMRVVSRFRDVHVTELAAAGDDGDDASLMDPAVDSLGLLPHVLTIASADSLSADGAWRLPLGEATAAVNADDFIDVAPDAWRPTGAPRVDIVARRTSDVVHFNRIEGLATGLGAEWRLRDAAPGLTVRGRASWAWSEQALRGAIDGVWRRGVWTPGFRLGRTLDVTSDFAAPRDSGSGVLAALFGVDDYDYVDRRAATVSLERSTGADAAYAARIEAGLVSDRGAAARLTRGALGQPADFRPNRTVDDGTYAREQLSLEWHPAVNADVMRQGAGASVSWTRADGGRRWQRVEVRVNARQQRGAFAGAVRADAGVLFGPDVPAQQLFEIGRGEGLVGYGYKEFAGDRAALVRALATYELPVWRSPLRFLGARWLPAPSPEIAVSLQGGATSVSSQAAAIAVQRLGSMEDRIGASPVAAGIGMPVSRPSGGFRSSIELGLRFFGGGVGMGLARPIDHGAAWRAVVTLGRAF